MWRGDTVFIDAAVTLQSVPVNITGCSLRFTAKQSLNVADSEAVFQLSTPGSITITNGPGGLCTITIASIDTSAIVAPMVCFCDLQLVDTSGNVSTLSTGMLTIKMDVTRTNT